MDRVEVRGFAFRAQRFGLTPGCWRVGRPTAKRLVELYLGKGNKLPQVGWERVLARHEACWPDRKIGGLDVLSNHAGQYLVRLFEFKLLES